MTIRDQSQGVSIFKEEPQDVVANPAQLLSRAVEKDLDIEKLERLMLMQERWDERQARKKFYEALSAFQAEVPEIPKTQEVSFNQTHYKYAALSDIAKAIAGALLKYGLSYRWTFDTEGEMIVTCIVTHVDGHAEPTTMSAPIDGSGKKNAVQSRASSITYLQRYTLVAALGLTTANEDNDGRTNTAPQPETQPQAEPEPWELPTKFDRSIPIWLGDYKGQAFSELPDDYLDSMIFSIGDSKNTHVIRAQEFAEKEKDERNRELEGQES